MTNDFDVIVIGGGITGAATARDCSMRGFRTLLIERNDIADGASGRNHGMLHSGARYAVKDSESARECIVENRILRKIASNCVEDNKGISITLPEDVDAGFGLDYQETFIKACLDAGIDAEKISPERARQLEPSVNPALIGAVVVPDGSMDPFRICSATVLDAQIHGAKVLRYTEFLEFLREGDTITGVLVLDKASGEKKEYHAAITVNAAGIWGSAVAEKAGVKISMYPAKGTLLVFGHRVNNMVISRCRKSADGDILVPGDAVTIIGTTSTKVPFEECDNLHATREEVELMLREGCALCPSLAHTRILRAYAGVRPLVSSDDDPTGRSISRGIVCLDHETRDGISGFISITGGKFVTHRLMGEIATDLVCRKLGSGEVCRTAVTPLAGSEMDRKGAFSYPEKSQTLAEKSARGRHGDMAANIDFTGADNSTLVCECEHVSFGEIKYAVDKFGVRTLTDLRRRTRLGMGTCQGTYCIRKAAAALAKAIGAPEKADELVKEYLDERWKGMVPVGWGDTLREMELMQKVYKEGITL